MSTHGLTSRAAQPTGTRPGKVLVASVAASSIEYYDFMIYGTAASLIFNSHFFPSINPTAGVLASFATFAVGFAARPVGAAVFGHFGDKFGRKPALLGAMLLMAIASTLIGVLPTYATIGIAAPIALTVLRCAQGAAVGGQWGGAALMAIEHAPPNRRGLFGAIPQLGVPVGMITGTLLFLVLNQVLDADQFSAWGWRVPFLLSIMMFPIAYYIHRFIEDTPAFQKADDALAARSSAAQRSSVFEVLRRPRQLLLAAGTFVPATIAFYVINTGMLDYGTRDLGMSKSALLTAVLISMVGWTVGTLGFAWLSDIVGRRAVFAGGAIFTGIWAFAIFPLVQTRSFGLVVLAALVGLLAVGAMQGPVVALFAEMFPPSVRYAGASMGTQGANIVGGGLAPLIMVALLETTHTTISVSVYVATAAALSLIPLAMIGRGRRHAD
ncbi:MFS transporter [Rhodococcus sp. T2V]|uniref:MFS transporter n=1 Tax=Rhodococcus sp. T2V TaxID=3034164 RepID=UPI0023E2CACE|nr:MFS transporter [Rhodococcus sp. T2V]MDF3310766.1 MFS transporter [Rhodococcus sp. T2V]